MSKDPNAHVGAVIIGPDNEIRASGFNGFPRGILDSQERLQDRDMKLRLIVHAEMNAILSAARVGIPVKGCTMYLVATDNFGKVWGGPPCVRCTVEIIQAGITEIVSYSKQAVPFNWHDDLELAESLLTEAGVTYRTVASGEI